MEAALRANYDLFESNEQNQMRCLHGCRFMSKQNLWFLLDISPRTSNMRMYFHPYISSLHSQRALDIPGSQWELDPQMPL